MNLVERAKAISLFAKIPTIIAADARIRSGKDPIAPRTDLNFSEKFHCTYCAYASGLVSYVSAIIGKTEEYFCPIKHARHILGSHARYNRFLDYGDAADYEGRLEEFRRNLDDTPKP